MLNAPSLSHPIYAVDFQEHAVPQTASIAGRERTGNKQLFQSGSYYTINPADRIACIQPAAELADFIDMVESPNCIKVSSKGISLPGIRRKQLDRTQLHTLITRSVPVSSVAHILPTPLRSTCTSQPKFRHQIQGCMYI
ncbi:uncharacterized protein BDCG_16305 [Blastomyces dermatitidis ER-3]|uniref:Uncharacterized protein n=1 Tax=Ajellomyces dermatitidis (strain ER-3 / ATCC MYA-2586) TaxID=559297 RepID=A0ABX2VSI5_AJEDR|nr:uncharacterized protein BDCG_16305 [Blastomyces dermatitidis ER-3]OAS99775.1 hypothetical protein BDCG_16305 [Blastomyces dermatitidis ER-3]